MFKLAGCIFVLAASVLLFSKRVFCCYFTGRMLTEISQICNRLLYERNTNLTYTELFAKIGFDGTAFTVRYGTNPYTDRECLQNVMEFLANLGRHDSESEEKYIVHNMQRFTVLANDYRTQYQQNRKVYLLSGFSLGVFVIMVLI